GPGRRTEWTGLGFAETELSLVRWNVDTGFGRGRRGAEARRAEVERRPRPCAHRARVTGAVRAWASSYSTGGMSPSSPGRRRWLYQPTHSTIASSSWSRVRQTRSAISSVLNESTNDSAIALS